MPAVAARPVEPFDELTLRRAQRGEERAWRALIDRYQAPVHAHRTKGNKSIMPDKLEQITIAASREPRVVASVELCVDPAGKVSKVRLVKASGYPGYDEKIVDEMKNWEFQPIEIDGKAVPVCSAVTFIYSQR